MIVGDRHQFAVESEFTSQVGRWIFGQFRVWVGGNAIGTYSEEVMDLVCTTGVLRERVPHASPAAASLGSQELLDRVWSVVYGKGKYNDDEHRVWKPYEWFASCQGFENVRSVIANVGSIHRIVWQISGEQSAREHAVPAEIYEAVASEFISWLDRGIEERRKGLEQ